MKHLVIGTAGHVDHGKTQLTLALTGTNTDRLAEEQRRGITIEVGFAKLVLPNGQTASIVDVPGHERFIKNMLAGASGMDVVLLVVAADEGFMPQTQEHLDILSLLGVQNGILVITKTDLVTEDWLALVMAEIREQVAGTFLASAPMLPVSAVTGAGMDALKQAIVQLVENTPARTDDRPFRLPVDRVFSRPGYGVIVTGTLIDGGIQTGQTAMLYPQQKIVRVRELQNHGESVPCVSAGMRAALNIAGADKDEIRRGAVLAAENSLQLSDRIAVQITLHRDSPYSVRNSSQLHFYHGTRELLCKVRLLDADELPPGQSGYAQLTLSEPLAARGLDRFILRFYSPVTTIGGGVILDMAAAARYKRHQPAVIARLFALHASPQSRVLQLLTDAGDARVQGNDLLTLSGLSKADLHAALSALLADGQVLELADGYIAATALMSAWETVSAALTAFHEWNPLSPGMPLGELREKAFPLRPQTADAILQHFRAEGKLRLDGPHAALSQHAVRYTVEQAAMREKLLSTYESFGFLPQKNDEIAASFAGESALFSSVFMRMCLDGELVPLTSQYTVHAHDYENAKSLFLQMFTEKSAVTLAEFRTALQVSRKVAQLYLDAFDRQKISKLIGESRVLLIKP